MFGENLKMAFIVQVIRWPACLELTSGDFEGLSGFPYVLGSLDTMHLAIRAPER